jgi:hypothetical protein
LSLDNQTLYARHVFQYRWGGHNLHNGFRTMFSDGAALGTKGCDAECLKEWHPFIADANSSAEGYWTLLDRGDGTRQWAYKGNPIYTYTKDPPGAVRGNNLYETVGANEVRYKVAEVERDDAPTSGAALFWHVAKP